MPLLDVGFMTVDPMLADTFDVRRWLAFVGDDGRSDSAPSTLFRNVMGGVTHQDPADLIRTEDGQNIPKRIFIASRFQFMQASATNQPDEIHWNGLCYRVEHSLPYNRYGSGIYEVIAEYRNSPVPPAQ